MIQHLSPLAAGALLPLLFVGLHQPHLHHQDKDKKEAPATPAVATVGQPAPEFRVNDHRGRAVKVGGPAKTWTVLAFYPKAATPG